MLRGIFFRNTFRNFTILKILFQFIQCKLCAKNCPLRKLTSLDRMFNLCKIIVALKRFQSQNSGYLNLVLERRKKRKKLKIAFFAALRTQKNIFWVKFEDRFTSFSDIVSTDLKIGNLGGTSKGYIFGIFYSDWFKMFGEYFRHIILL